MRVYFAYGSNMSSARLLARVASARPLGAVHVDGWRLAFNKPGRDGSGKANLTAAAGSRVWGVAWRLAGLDWADLDRFEPGYDRVVFRLARASGESLDAHAYTFNGPADTTSRVPTPEYVAHLLDGAREHGLPDPYIEEIRFASLATASRTSSGGAAV